MIGKCPHCGQKFECEDADAGKLCKCPHCNKRFVINKGEVHSIKLTAQGEVKAGGNLPKVMIILMVIIVAILLGMWADDYRRRRNDGSAFARAASGLWDEEGGRAKRAADAISEDSIKQLGEE